MHSSIESVFPMTQTPGSVKWRELTAFRFTTSQVKFPGRGGYDTDADADADANAERDSRDSFIVVVVVVVVVVIVVVVVVVCFKDQSIDF